MKTKMMILWLVLLFGLAVTASATVPVVTNVVSSQRASTKLVDIYYDVSDAEGDPLKISVEVSHSGGATFNIPASSFTGDYGDNVSTGVNKHIVWDAGKDWDGEYSTQMVVKVTASDTIGLPGLQWGSEVPSGGFLMGQEGGAEGYGPSLHVNIPWSYWLSKYEITSAQYVEYLNLALAAGKVLRNGTTSVSGLVGVSSNKTLINLDVTRDIVWNVNAFEVANGTKTNFPVRVTWYGAIAFAQFYGYDLPTEAEWEKAARGPDHAGVDQHQVYPWGNTLVAGNANYYNSGHPYGVNNTTPVGYFNGNQVPIGSDMANGYGMYDVAGNVCEWCRSMVVSTVETYPALESLTNSVNIITNVANRIVRGGGQMSGQTTYDYGCWKIEALKCYQRYSIAQNVDYTYYNSGSIFPDIGIRVIRRSP